MIVVSFPETYTPRVLVEVKEEEPEKTKRVDIVTTLETTEKAKHRKARALERMQSYLEIVSYTVLCVHWLSWKSTILAGGAFLLK